MILYENCDCYNEPLYQEEKDEFIESVLRFVKSDFTPIDVARFVKRDSLAFSLLKRFDGGVDYNEELEFLKNHSIEDIEALLDVSHSEYYDSEYGSLDSLPSFRLTKECFAECVTIDDVRETDNIISHMLSQLDKELITIPMEKMLNEEYIERLGKSYDCEANQIYYFKKISESQCCFLHCYRVEGDCWELDKNNIDISDYKQFRLWLYVGSEYCVDVDSVVKEFYHCFEGKYIECQKQYDYKSKFSEVVFNGEDALKQLMEFVFVPLKQYASVYIKETQEQITQNIVRHISNCKYALKALGIEDINRKDINSFFEIERFAYALGVLDNDIVQLQNKFDKAQNTIAGIQDMLKK